jgi:two-component system chemotaxis response regulator CheB
VGVVLVDDSALMRQVTRRMLAPFKQAEVVGEAANGVEGIDVVARESPDVVILDLEMPLMTGIEFLKVRERRGWDMPVIVLSSIARRGARVTMEALALGAS